jgi:hypothetical protein
MRSSSRSWTSWQRIGAAANRWLVHMTRETRYIIFIGLAFVLLGLWQHLYFSYTVREFAFFKNAYDEDTYVLFPFGAAGFRPDRALSGTIVSGLLSLSHGSYGFVLTAMDALLPPLIFLAAYYAGAAIFTKSSARCLFALVLVFSTDLFSLGSAASYPGLFPTLEQFKALVGAEFVPPFETSYLGLYRSPEPQVSYVVGYLFTGLLLRILFRSGQDLSWREIAAVVLLQALLMTCYALISYPLLIIEGLAAGILLLNAHRRAAAVVAILFLASIILALIFARTTLGSSTSVVFNSHLPIITVGALLALALTVVLLLLLLRGRRADPRLMISLAFATVPLALTNQQILTGLMASTREWERYVDLPFVVISAGVLISTFPSWKRFTTPMFALAMIAVAGFVYASSVHTYRLWLPDNLKSLAIARAVTAAGASLDGSQLVLDQPEYAPLVETRLGRPLHALLDFTDTFKHPPAPTSEPGHGALAEALFEYWRQTGVSPEMARKILEQEARERAGYYSGFLFNQCEYWYPCTDGRGVKTGKILASLPGVIDAYAAFLAIPAPPRKFAFVTSKFPSAPSKTIAISEGRAASVTARISLPH